MKKHHVACDLDGTLAYYDGWKGISHIGDPVPSVMNRVLSLLEAGHEVTIFTARVARDSKDHERELEEVRHHIEVWCRKHIGRILPITAIKRSWFTEIWDDKSLGFWTNKGEPLHRVPLAYAWWLSDGTMKQT